MVSIDDNNSCPARTNAKLPVQSSKRLLARKTRRMVNFFSCLVLLAFWFMAAGATRESELRRALNELAASLKQQDGITAQDLIEGPPELTTSLPLFNQLVREEKRELLFQMGELHFFAGGSVPHNATHAELFLRASAAHGSAQAQFLLGALQNSFDDSAGAQLFYEFAARGQSIGASMALGYRALHGYGSTKSCTAAMRHYKFAADRVVRQQNDQKLQMYAFPEHVRLSETEGARHHSNVNPAEDFNRAEYLRQRAADLRSADVMVQSASITLFSDLYEATLVSGLEEHAAREREALRFLERSIEMGSIKAQALLGHVYAYGLAGCKHNVTRAVELYEAALNASAGNPSGEAANGLGVIFSRGIGDMPVDQDRAHNFFKVAANAGHADGVYNTGMAFLELGSHLSSHAKEYFVAAAHVGHLKSLFQLARLKQRQLHRVHKIGGVTTSSSSCEEVVELYKRVAEHCREGTTLMTKALTHAQHGNWAVALELYLIAAEMGYEVAQSNAIWLIERVQHQVFGASSARSLNMLERLQAQLVSRAVKQDSVAALLQFGDSAFQHGEYTVALRHYQQADLVSAGASAQALYNIGYMYEHGLGVSLISPDWATLYYHLAGEKEQSLRIVMSLLQFKLRVQSTLTQVVNLVQWGWSTITLHSDDASATMEDVSSSRMDQSIEDGSAPTSRDVSKLDTHGGTFHQQINTLVDSTTFTGTEDSKQWSDPHELAAALQFLGDQSQVIIELTRGELLLEHQDFTIETWLRVDDFPARTDDQQVITLVDAQDNFQLELLPAARDDEASSWMLRFRKFSLVDEQCPELVISFSNAPLIPHTWNHVAVTFDATYQTVTLLLNATMKQVLSFRPHLVKPRRDEKANEGNDDRSSLSLAIGNSIGRVHGVNPPTSHAFSGQLVHFRVWKSRKSLQEISVLMVEQYDNVASQDLLIHLRYKLHGSPTYHGESSHSKPAPTRVLNGDDTVPNAQGVNLKIVAFPPHKN